MSKLRFGICGLGFIGREHFARLHASNRAEIVAVCDQDEARRQGDWADRLGNLDLGGDQTGPATLAGIQACATPAELIADPQVDAVLIALPTPLHAEVAIAALEAGKHVLTEKPMARRVAECDRMIRAAEANARTLMVAHCIRFWPQYEAVKRLLDEGRIGALRFAILRRLGSLPTYSEGNWLLNGQQSGGAALDLHVHDVDFVQWMLGVPDVMYARGTIGTSGALDHIVATYAYDDGRYAIIEGGWVHPQPWPFEMAITVHGERGTLDWSSGRGSDVLLHAGGERPESISCDGDAIQREQEYFIDQVLAGRPVERCTPKSSRVSVALAWLERRSVELGRQLWITDRLRSAWGV